MLNIKSVLIMFMILFVSCNSDDCYDDSDTADSFPAKFKIISSNGQNQLTNAEFDSSLLKLVDADFPNSPTIFDIVDANSEPIIEFGFAIRVRNIIFEYDGENKFEIQLSDRQTRTENCATETLSFKANLADGTLICDCEINEFVSIEFDI